MTNIENAKPEFEKPVHHRKRAKVAASAANIMSSLYSTRGRPETEAYKNECFRRGLKP